MSFSQGTASHVVPLVARLVLAAAFIPAGWGKLTHTAHFTPEEATTLRSLGVSVTDTATPEASRVHRVVLRHGGEPVDFGVTAGSSAELFEELATAVRDAGRASDQDDDAVEGGSGDVAPPPVLPPDRRRDRPNGSEVPAQTGPTPPGPTPPGPTPPGPTPPAPIDRGTILDDAAGPPPVLPAPPAGGSAMALHRVTLMVHAEGWPLPVVQGWAAMTVELLGGALLLIGLFSRLWGLGLAVTMGVAFYLTSWPLLQDTSLFALAIPDYNRLFAQAGLFALAFGVLLTGPGAVSLDRLLFRPAGVEPEPTPA